jgi:hypothetical protein
VIPNSTQKWNESKENTNTERQKYTRNLNGKRLNCCTMTDRGSQHWNKLHVNWNTLV